jgi:penicillin-binding protein 1A
MVALLAMLLVTAGCSLAPIDLKKERPLALRTTISAGDGSTLARLYSQNRALVDYDVIPDVLKDAVVSAEDARFFRHPGYDIRSIARAALVNLGEGTVVQGGSTITQQYVKNTFFRHPGRTLHRKARELRLAIEVERRFTKEEILARYLNTVYLGGGAYGIKVATRNYFGHGLEDMELHEAALLAAVIKAPSFYDPRAHPNKAIERRNYVLRRMADLGKITAEESEAAIAHELGIKKNPPKTPSREPYFVEAVKREIMSEPRFGETENERAKALYSGGLRIQTTLDLDLQEAAREAIDSTLGLPGDPEAALVAIKPETGEIVAMIGGRDWNASQVNLALGVEGGGSGRQAGSSFKPIVAATALEQGVSLDTRFDAGPGIFTLPDGSTWTVHNSEGTSGGSLPINEALVRSVNGVFARLSLYLGASTIAEQAKLMGIRSRLPIYPSIALGTGQISVLDMATAYATLANHGTAIEPTTIRTIKTAAGETIEPHQKIVPEAVSPGNAFTLTKVMEQVILRGTGHAANIGRPAAGKTGTTNDYADAWFVGFTPELAVAVWVGYPQGAIPMTNVHGIRVFGGTFPALIWKAFMLKALEGVPPTKFSLPPGQYVHVLIDPVSGLLAAPWCPGERVKMIREQVPREYCPVPAAGTDTLPGYEPYSSPTPTPTKKGAHWGQDRPRNEPSPSPSHERPDPEPSPEPSTEPSPTPTS